MISLLNKNQLIGAVIAIIGLPLGLFWEKSFKYSDGLDFVFGVISAIGFCMVLKLLPLKKKQK